MKIYPSRRVLSLFLLLFSLRATCGQIDSLNLNKENAIIEDSAVTDIEKPRNELFVYDNFYNDVTKVVGNTPTNASVSSSGAAIYTIPIAIPKGYGDFGPSISLIYNSQTGNNIAGYGVNISGISVITRGVKDIYHDGVAQGIKYQPDDAYYLDGKRLLLVSGIAGVDGAVYAPEGEALTSITMHNTAGDIWFETNTTNGMRYEYGKTSISRQEFNQNGTTMTTAWYVSKAEDPIGLYLSYYYYHDNYHVYPSSILYGNGNSVNFEYESRYDILPFIHGTTKGSMRKRLKKIVTKYNNNVYRQYQLGYITDKVTRLSSVSEQDANGNSFHPVLFNWNEIGGLSPQSTDVSATLTVTDNCGFFTGDINGDGKDDIIQLYEPSDNNYTWAYVSCSTNSNNYSSPKTCRFPKVSFTGSTISIHELLPTVVDLDGDGKDDIVFPYLNQSGNTYSYRLEYILGNSIASSSGTVFSQETTVLSNSESMYCVADFNNDGKADLVVMGKTPNGNSYPCHLLDYNGTTFVSRDFTLTLSSAPKRFFAADFNHDGLTDIMIVRDDGYNVFWNNTGLLSTTTFTNSASISNSTLSNSEILEIGDFNGDGVPDFVSNSLNNSNWYLKLGNNDGSFTSQLAANLPVYVQNNDLYNRHARCLVFDFDRDGKSDIVIHKVQTQSGSIKTRTYWMQSTGNALTIQQNASSNSPNDGLLFRILFGDFRGIGYPELMNYGNDCYNGVNAVGTPKLRLYQMGDAENGKINAVRGSLGNITYFNYAALTDNAIYTRGTGCTYPLRDVSTPLCVTTYHKEQGRSVSYWDYYTYGGLKAHIQGRGIIGFERVTIAHNNYTTISNYMSDWDNDYLVPTHTQKVVTCDGYTSSSESEFYLKSFGNNYLLYPGYQVDTDIDNHTTTTTYLHNQNLGYLQQQKIEYDGNSMYRQIDYSDFTYIGRSYRPQTITYSQKHVDDANPYSQKTKLTYNNNGLPATVTDAFETDYSLTHSYTYNTWGNVLTESLTGTDINVTNYYQYNSGGDRITKSYTSPSAITMQYTYDNYGNLQYENDATDLSTIKTIRRYNYNGLGNITSYGTLNDFSPVVTRGWGETFYEKSYTLERCQGYPWKKTWYDTNGRVSKIETVGPKGLPIESIVHCNGNGQPTYQYHRNGSVSTYEYLTYDHLNRLQSQVFSTGKTVSYSYGDRSITKTENGQSFTTVYDAWGNIKSSTDPASSVSYTYFSNGKPRQIVTNGHTITLGYDEVGNQASLSDPDAGTTTYTYDALGRLKLQTDARGIETSFTYDGANRITQKTVDNIPTTYTYGTSGHSANCLLSMQTGDRSIAYTYNNSRQLVGETRTMSGMTPLTFYYEYNNNDLVYTTYPNGFLSQNNFDGFGHIQAVNLDDGTNVWYLDNSDGQDDLVKIGGDLEYADDPYADDPDMQNDPIYSYYSQEYFNVPNPVMTNAVSRDVKGFLSSTTLTKGNNTVSHFTYTHDYMTGNLLTRTGMLSQQESFAYDNLDRLTSVTVGNTTQMTMTYGNNGNITSKTGLGSYYYNNTNVRPHAVTGIQYASGLPSTGSQQITYNALGKVASISEGQYSLDFIYGPDEQRWKSVLKRNGTTVRTTIYANNYERITEGSNTLHFCYMDGGAVNIAEDNDDGTTYYIVTDNLGSVTKLVDLDGNVDFEASYDVWGKQILGSNNSLDFHRGYTGHEMMPEFNLINMNGRLYDPALGRFLSPDNYVQLPDFSQSFNRYSYCLNNPLKYTDPSGESPWLILGMIAGAYLNGVAANSGEFNPLKWNYSDPLTYLGIGFGALTGGITGSVLAGSTAWGVNFLVGNAYLAAGVTGGPTASSGWQWGFHWATAGGGGYDWLVEKAVKKAGETVDNFVNQYRQHMEDIHTGLDIVGLIPGGDFADLANAGLYILEGDYTNAGISAAAMVPLIGGIATTGKNAWKAGDVINSLGSNYTKSSLKNGINVHKFYKLEDVIPGHAIKEYRGINGIRPDFVDIDKHIIYELKPGNKNGILNGYKQLNKYKSIFENYYPGSKWSTILELY